MKKSLAIVGPVFLAIASIPASAPAQPTAPACSAPPPKPEGHILAKIDSIDARGNAKINLPAGLTGRDRVKNGDDVHLLTCEGVLVREGRADVDAVNGNVATASFKSLKNAQSFANQWVAIDNGFQTATPIGPVSLEITDIQSDGYSAKLTVGGGEEEGVFPGAEGRIILKDKRSLAIRVNSVTRRAAQLVVPRVNADDVRGATVLIQIKAPKCFPPKPIDPNDFGLVATRTTPPTGYIFAKGNVQNNVLTADKGSDDRVVAGEAYLLTSTLIPVTTGAITPKNTSINLQTAGVRINGARVLLPVLPLTSPTVGLKCTK